jgi:hypothetical protein
MTRRFCAGLVLLAAIAVHAPTRAQNEPPVVQTANGAVRERRARS